MVASTGGVLTVNGESADLGPYGRFENQYVSQPWGARQTVLELDGASLDLNFEAGTRTYTPGQ